MVRRKEAEELVGNGMANEYAPRIFSDDPDPKFAKYRAIIRPDEELGMKHDPTLEESQRRERIVEEVKNESHREVGSLDSSTPGGRGRDGLEGVTARTRQSTRPIRTPRRADEVYSAAIAPTDAPLDTGNGLTDDMDEHSTSLSNDVPSVNVPGYVYNCFGSKHIGAESGFIPGGDPASDHAPGAAQSLLTANEDIPQTLPEHMDENRGPIIVAEPIVQAPIGVQEPRNSDLEPTTVLYFVGVISAPGNQTVFCVPGPAVDTHRAGGIIDFLVFANGPAGRTLESLNPCSEFRVAISRVPEDIANDFMSFRNGFVEVGHLDVICAAPADSARVPPARDSELRTALIESLGFDEDILVFVIYIYPENTSPLAIQSVAPTISQPSNATHRFQELRFTAKRDELHMLLNIPGYESAYKHCLIERQIMALVARMQAGHPVEPPMEPRHHTFFATLNSMMSTRILSSIDPHSGYIGGADLQVADANAVRMKISTLRSQVAEVKAVWGGQYM
ncbi:hypothetical protein B0H13DRAFT_1884877 [Mycena leptocephala]|nr:hypothetical protein B0H13DRAFT_1884877 [Mycena leptocephala]